MYVARDKSGRLYLYAGAKPTKHPSYYYDKSYWIRCKEEQPDYIYPRVGRCYSKVELPAQLLPNVKWEDREPTEVELKEIVP